MTKQKEQEQVEENLVFENHFDDFDGFVDKKRVGGRNQHRFCPAPLTKSIENPRQLLEK